MKNIWQFPNFQWINRWLLFKEAYNEFQETKLSNKKISCKLTRHRIYECSQQWYLLTDSPNMQQQFIKWLGDQNDFYAVLWFKNQFSSQKSYFWHVILNSCITAWRYFKTYFYLTRKYCSIVAKNGFWHLLFINRDIQTDLFCP